MHATRSMNELASKSGITWHRTERAVKRLIETGWMRLLEQPMRFLPSVAVPHPVQVRLAKELQCLYNLSPHRGEFLMEYYLALRIHTCEYVENAHPEFLINPATSERLEYDMFFAADSMAYEFNGPQHVGELIPGADEKAVKDQLVRDAFKRNLSAQHQIRLIEVSAATVIPSELEKLIPTDVPRRPVDVDGPLYKSLTRLATAHANKAARSKR